MSGQPDSSDDLIAELAKLMATNAKPEPAPAPVPRPAATVKPIRIPGADQPVPADARQPEQRQPEAVQPEQRQPEPPRPSAPVVRIPGMDMPAPGTNLPPPPAQPFEPRIVAESPRPAEPRAENPAPAPTPAQPAAVSVPDPIAAIIAAELEQAPPRAEEQPPAQPAPRPVPVAPVATRFNAAPRPSQPAAPAPRPTPVPVAPQPRVQPTTPINLKPIANDRARVDDDDSFGISPVTGVAARGRAGSDPIAEIENLIGEAVRVDMDRPPPVVTPVTIPTPRRTQPIEPKAETAPRSADEAILAAAAATGRPVEVLDDMAAPPLATPVTEPDGDGIVLPPSRPRPSSLRQYVGMAVAGTLLLAAGFGLYWVLGMGRDTGTVPVLTADSSPVKVAPAPSENASAEPRSPVLDELDGVTTDANAETIVSTDESTDTDVAAAAPDDSGDSGLANRKVRTVTVRPDGTIVADDDAVAGSEQLAATRPNVPDVPSDAASAAEVLTSAAEGVAADDPIAATIANPDSTPTTGSTEMALVDPATAPDAALDPNAPIPMPPLLGRATQPMVTDAAPLSAVNAVTDSPLPAVSAATTTNGQPLDLLTPDNVAPPAPTTTASTAGAVPVTAANTASAYVQLSAQRDQETALADARRFTQRFASVIGDTPLEVHIVDLGAKGTWYRVLLPASSGSDANIACASIKAAGGDCLVR